MTLITLVAINELNDWQAYKGWCRRDRTKGKRIPIPSELFVVSVLSSYQTLFQYHIIQQQQKTHQNTHE